jgi:flagellar biosynthesis protein
MKKHKGSQYEGKRRLAVALEYEHGQGAPRVTAKGGGAVAEQIIALAEQHGIPVRQDKELVAVLGQLDLEQEIPEVLYRVVAEVIAFAYLLKGKFPFPDATESPGRPPHDSTHRSP